MSLKADLALNLHKDFIEQVTIVCSHDFVTYLSVFRFLFLRIQMQRF